MNIYFTASVAGKSELITNYQKIVQSLTQKKHQVISDHILKSDSKTIDTESPEAHVEFQKKVETWIKSCDFLIAETSHPSISVGYEISFAIHIGKPVLILYSDGSPPSLLAHHQNEKIVCEKYTLTNLSGIIDDFIAYVENADDVRFTFFITSEINAYLEKISKKERMPKSVYLRKLIEREMKVS